MSQNDGSSGMYIILCILVILLCAGAFFGMMILSEEEPKKDIEIQQTDKELMKRHAQERERSKAQMYVQQLKKEGEVYRGLSCNVGYHSSNNDCVPNKCICENGIAPYGVHCETDGLDKCSTCDFSYHLNNLLLCQKNKCKCTNGIAVDDDDCEINDDEVCKSCNPNRTLNYGYCDLPCNCENGSPFIDGSCGTVKDNGDCEICDSGFELTEKNYCKSKCSCDGGTALISEDCNDDDEICTSCNKGYSWSSYYENCTSKCTTCDNGVVYSGDECEDDNKLCSSCNDGYFLKNKKCIRCKSKCDDNELRIFEKCSPFDDIVCGKCTKPEQSVYKDKNIGCAYKCNEGYILKDNDCIKCKKCQKDFFIKKKCSDKSDTICGECDTNFMPDNSHYLNEGIDCEWTCNVHYYRDTTLCKECSDKAPENAKYTNKEVSIDCDWKCNPGYYRDGNVCRKCLGPTPKASHYTNNCNWECDKNAIPHDFNGMKKCLLRSEQQKIASSIRKGYDAMNKGLEKEFGLGKDFEKNNPGLEKGIDDAWAKLKALN
jgi:hypothetical protein